MDHGGTGEEKDGEIRKASLEESGDSQGPAEVAEAQGLVRTDQELDRHSMLPHRGYCGSLL